MSWHYRIRKRIIQGEPWYDIVEYVTFSKKSGWTKESMAPGAETKKGVIRMLEIMLQDARKYKAFTDKEKD